MRKILAVLFFAYVAISLFGPKQSESRSAAPAVAPVAKTPEQEAEERAQNKRRSTALLVAVAIKRSLRDPDSVKWTSIGANDDASVICVEYRARNGFGGMDFGRATYANNQLQSSTKAWNSNCADKHFYEMSKTLGNRV